MRRVDVLFAVLSLVAVAASSAAAQAPVGGDAGRQAAGPLEACGQLLDAQTCRQCHPDQYKDWSVSQHARQDVQCFQCHGALHSGSLHGCKRCHQAIHRKRFSNWTEVTRFDDENSADYICMLCHKAHVGNLQANLKEGCAVCHGSAGHTAVTDLLHTRVATTISPMHVDQFAREQHGLAARLAIMPRGCAAGLALAMVVGGYALGFLVFLPLGYSMSSAWEFFFAGCKKQRP